MGFASYGEDIESRVVSATYRATPRPQAVATARGMQSSELNHNGAIPPNSREEPMSIIEVTLSEARPLPVFILADVSGSMADGGKIAALNLAVKELLTSLAGDDDLRAAPHVAVITFGGTDARLHVTLQPAEQIHWSDMRADGATPMGAAFQLLKAQLEDKNIVASRAYRPTIVLVSDGQPNDAWETALEELLGSERAAKADRFALAIGQDADDAMLVQFTGDRELVLRADAAKDIRKFFRFVSMSVQARTRSLQPNARLPPPDLDTLIV